MKTKEQILKEFRKRFRYKFDVCNKDEKIEVNGNWLFIEDFISQALAQTREETIREVEEKVGELRHELGQEESLDKTDREYFKEGHSECLNEVLDILNKLKK